MKLILIRHGQTPSNVRQLLDTGIPGPGLTELGREQALAVADSLGGQEIAAIYASNLVRTQETAAPLASALGLEVQIRDGLREIGAGELEMLGDEASVRTYLRTVYRWVSGERAVRMPGGPNGEETFSRFNAVIDEVLSSARDTVALVSHGAMIRAWTSAYATNVTADFMFRNWLSNTGVVVLEHRGGEWELLTWMGDAVGGPALADAATDGPTADPVSP